VTRLQDLSTQQQQSPWLDNLKRSWITNGEIERWVERGVRGITSNPSIFQKAMETGDAYDEQLASLAQSGESVLDCYWQLVVSDIRDALRILRNTFDASDREDGYVSVEVAPDLARDTAGTIAAARHLNELINEPNLYIKIPGTAEGLPAIQQMISEGRSINVTLLFSVDRYREVIEAYLSGLEAHDGDLSTISSVASFFVSRVDTEVDKRLAAIGTEAAIALQGKAAIANAVVAYQLFLEQFSGPRWDALAARGARKQRPLWASTSTKNPAFPDTLYIDALIGPDTVNTIPDATLEAFDDHGVVTRTLDSNVEEAFDLLRSLEAVGVDLADATALLEVEGVASFSTSFDDLLTVLQAKVDGFRN